jgi:anti-sigma factor RsiW
MHVSLEALLELRDGAAEAAVVDHVAACPECAAELERLRAVRAALGALPAAAPERDHWPAIAAAAEAERGRRRLARAGWLAAGVAAVVSLVAGVRGTVEAVQEMRLTREVRSLVAESQRLEQTLRSSDAAGRVVDGRIVGTIVNLEDRIAVIDSRLAPESRETLATQDALNLWHERVRLLDALVAVQSTRETYVGL